MLITCSLLHSCYVFFLYIPLNNPLKMFYLVSQPGGGIAGPWRVTLAQTLLFGKSPEKKKNPVLLATDLLHWYMPCSLIVGRADHFLCLHSLPLQPITLLKCLLNTC